MRFYTSSRLILTIVGTIFFCCLGQEIIYPFHFSDEKRKEKRQEIRKQVKINQLLSTPCQEKIKNKKIAVLLAEDQARGEYDVQQSRYSHFLSIINFRLRDLGLNTYSQQEITEQIKQAQIKAYMNNDPDAAINAADRLGADFILKGLISSRTTWNPVLRVNEVVVDITFTLTHASGQTISSLSQRADSYAGTDTMTVALDLVKSKAEEVVARLYHDYCKKASQFVN